MKEHVPGSKTTTTIPCCITGSHEAVVVATKDRKGSPLRTVIATASGLVFTDPRPTEKEIRQFYAHEYRQEYKGTFTPKRKHVLRAGRIAVKRLADIRRLLPENGAILDGGSGGGEFVYVCKASGYKARGIEPNKGYAEFSVNEYGIDVFNGFHQDAGFEEESFDCITLFHVLEHLEKPVASISMLSRFLKKGGYFIIEVPNVDFTQTAPMQKWHVGHLYNFNAQTLRAAGACAGLVPVEVSARGDGGVLFAVFQKPAEEISPDVNGIIDGSFEATYGILKGHTVTGHYARFHVPLSRLCAKVRRGFDERKVIADYDSRKTVDILDDLVSGKIR